MPLDGSDRLVAGVTVVIAVYGSLFGIAELLRRWRVDGERTRSLVHVTGAVLALGLPYLFGSPWPVAVMAIAFAALMVASRRLGLLGSIHDVPRETVGAAMFPLGIAAAFALTGGEGPGYPIAVLCLGLGDPAAALAGRRAHRYAAIWGTHRSLEGSAVACLVSGATAIVVLQMAGVDSRSLVVTALVVGVAVALAEATSPLGFDNLAIPSVAAVIVDVADAPWRLAAVVLALAMSTVAGVALNPSVRTGLTRRYGRVP